MIVLVHGNGREFFTIKEHALAYPDNIFGNRYAFDFFTSLESVITERKIRAVRRKFDRGKRLVLIKSAFPDRLEACGEFEYREGKLCESACTDLRKIAVFRKGYRGKFGTFKSIGSDHREACGKRDLRKSHAALKRLDAEIRDSAVCLEQDFRQSRTASESAFPYPKADGFVIRRAFECNFYERGTALERAVADRLHPTVKHYFFKVFAFIESFIGHGNYRGGKLVFPDPALRAIYKLGFGFIEQQSVLGRVGIACALFEVYFLQRRTACKEIGIKFGNTCGKSDFFQRGTGLKRVAAEYKFPRTARFTRYFFEISAIVKGAFLNRQHTFGNYDFGEYISIENFVGKVCNAVGNDISAVFVAGHSLRDIEQIHRARPRVFVNDASADRRIDGIDHARNGIDLHVFQT